MSRKATHLVSTATIQQSGMNSQPVRFRCPESDDRASFIWDFSDRYKPSKVEPSGTAGIV